MAKNNYSNYSKMFPDGMIKVSKKKQKPLIQVDDFYNRLRALQIRKSNLKIPTLTKFLNFGFRKEFL